MNRERRQAISIDGIETSLAMARIAYSRLYQAANQYSQASSEGTPRSEIRNWLLLDAWSLIDIANRMRVLVRQTPGLTQNAFVKSFLKATEKVETLRNFVQHLDGETANIAGTGWPIWGSLSWIWVTPEMHKEGRVDLVAIVPGPLAKSTGYPIVNPAGKEIRPPVDHISLSAAKTTVNLTELFRTSMLFGKRFEVSLARARESQSRGSSAEENALLRIVLADEAAVG